MPHRLFPVLCAALLLAMGSGAQATPYVPDFSNGPIVFDFEDGLQGWELAGSAERVPTDALGGDWAILGDGLDPPAVDYFPTGMYLQLDLTNVAAISFDVSFAGTGGRPEGFLIPALSRHPQNPIPEFFIPLDPEIPGGNPASQSMDASDRWGDGIVAFYWADPRICDELVTITPGITLCAGGSPPLESPTALLGFIDNITLHPVPEPGLGGLVLGSLAVVWALARRRPQQG